MQSHWQLLFYSKSTTAKTILIMLLKKYICQDLENELQGIIFNEPLNNNYIDDADSANYSDIDDDNNKKMVWTKTNTTWLKKIISMTGVMRRNVVGDNISTTYVEAIFRVKILNHRDDCFQSRNNHHYHHHNNNCVIIMMIRRIKGVTYQKQGCMTYGCNTGHLWCLTGLSGLRTVVSKIQQW